MNTRKISRKRSTPSRHVRVYRLIAFAVVAVAAVFTARIWAQTQQAPGTQNLRTSFDIRIDKEQAPDGYLDQHLAPVAAAAADFARSDAAGLAQLQSDFKGVEVVKGRLGVEVVGARPGSPFLSAPSDDRVATLRAFLSGYTGALGLSSSDVQSLEVVADYQNPTGNMGWVELEQRVNGVPVFQGYLRGAFTSKGELARTTGQLASRVSAASLAVAPVLNAAQAVSRAAGHVGWQVPVAALSQKAVADDGKVTLARGPLAEDSRAWLVYFPLAPGAMRLAWATEIWGDPDVFLVVLDAEDGTVLFRKYLTDFQTQTATYTVYNNDSPAPSSPTTATPDNHQQAGFISRATFTLRGNEAPNTFNNLGWMTDGVNVTDGNNVQAGIDRDGLNGVDAPVTGSPNRVFTFSYDPQTQEALTVPYHQGDVTNLFYWSNRFHDSTYLLGFTEAARNFQNDNFGRGGVGADRVSAEAQDSSGTNNANFSTPADGGRGRMQMYLWTGPVPDRSGGLDRDIVLHELAHGLSNRLHANGSGLNSTMARGMGEGWSDFYARALYATADESVNGVYTIGGWATHLGSSGYVDNYYYGIRRFPYAVKTSAGPNGKPHNPLTFADVDPAQINLTDGAYPRGPFGVSTAYAVHNIGEIWAMALFEVRARFITRLGFAEGNRRMLQYVTDAMKLEPATPTMLDGRDAILAAANAGGGTAADVADIWAGFATRGMGLSATVNSTVTGAVTEDFTTPTHAPRFMVNDVSVTEGNSGTTTATFTVTLANPNGNESRVFYATADGTATATTTVTSSGSMTIPVTGSTGPASPYPATLAVSGLTGTVQNLAVQLNSLTHTFPSDLDIVLVGPSGQKVMLMSDAGAGVPVSGINLTFRDGFPAMPAQLVTGAYAPTDMTPGETLPSPAPAGPYGTSLAAFNGTNPNGTWSLHVYDDEASDVGSIGSFSVLISTGTSDYIATAGQLTFPAGTTTRTVAVTVNGDAMAEANETFTLNLSSPANAVISDGVGGGTIVNDDGAGTSAAMTSPANGSLIPATTTFTWNTGSGVLEYWLSVGTTLGGGNIYYSSEGLGLSRSVPGIPQIGSTVFVRLWSRLSSGWVSRDYTYIGGAALASMMSPVNGSQLTSTTTTFTWTSGSGVTQIWLSVGTTVGGTQIYNATQGMATSRTLSGLPYLSAPVYVRLWSLRNAAWSYLDYVYTSVEHRARLLMPAAGGTLPGSIATFRWTPGSGVTQRWLYIGTTQGGNNLYDVDQTTLLERTVSGLPTNNTVLYARLWSLINGAWVYLDYSFRAANPALAALTSPAIGSTFTGSSATLTWTIPGGVTGVWLYVGTTVGGSNILDANKGIATSHAVTGLPVNGSNVYARLWSLQAGTWTFVDYHFYATGGTKAALLLPTAGGTLPGSTATFRWTTGSGVTDKWLSVGTTLGGANLYYASQASLTERTVTGLPTTGVPLYARLWSLIAGVWQFTDYSFRAADPAMASLTTPVVGSKLVGSSATFTWVKPASVTQTWIYIGTTVGRLDLATVDMGTATSYTASGLPTTGGDIYVRLFSFDGTTWKYIDYYFTAAGMAVVGT